MIRWCAVALLAVHGNGWWSSPPNQTDVPQRSPYAQWLVDAIPGSSSVVESFERRYGEFLDWRENASTPALDSTLWLVVDSIIGLCGWLIFGSAWGNVRSGCRRLLQLLTILGLCLAAHYVWALCYPLVSIVVALLLGMVWLLRRVLRAVGTVVFLAQKMSGGAPEAADVEFHGPASGKTPETSTLRLFKKGADGNKQVVVRRGGLVAVFSLGSDNQTIRSHGLFVPVEHDSVRGDVELVRRLRRQDKIHLCRHEGCAEEGAEHFTEYGIVKKFNAERFQAAQAGQGASDFGRWALSWIWGDLTGRAQRVAAKVREYASESEADEPAMRCVAHLIRWEGEQGQQGLASDVCKEPGQTDEWLLREDLPPGVTTIGLCPRHATQYMKTRGCCACSVQGCKGFGIITDSGIRLCAEHSRGSPGATEDETKEHQAVDFHDYDPDYDEENGHARAHAILRTAQEQDEGAGPRRPLSRERSRPPYRSGSRPDTPRRAPSIEAWRRWGASTLPRIEAACLKVSSSGSRRESLWGSQMSRCGDTWPRSGAWPVAELTQILLDEAEEEQVRGQKGLTKFMQKWRTSLRRPQHYKQPPKSMEDSWSMVGSRAATPMVLSEVEEDRGPTGGPEVTEKKGEAIRIAAPGSIGETGRRGRRPGL